jgi:5-methylcytosine-specific restriction endonuclease McrA
MHQQALQRRYDDRRGTAAERGYDAAHERLRVTCFVRDDWRCCTCGWEPQVVADFRMAELGAVPVDAVLGELRRAKNAGERHLHADHIVPISGREDPRRLDLDNMQTLCDWCHRRKTMKEKGLRPPGSPADGVAGTAGGGPDREGRSIIWGSAAVTNDGHLYDNPRIRIFVFCANTSKCQQNSGF